MCNDWGESEWERGGSLWGVNSKGVRGVWEGREWVELVESECGGRKKGVCGE